MENRGTTDLTKALREVFPRLLEHEPMERHTSLAIGGPADYYAEVNAREELAAIRKTLPPSVPVFFVGAGSNLLVSDKGIRGIVIHLQGDFRTIEFHGNQVHTGTAVWMPALAKQAAERGLAGLEPLIGIPGTVGGGLVMNAGTREGSLGSVVTAVEALGPSAEHLTLGPEAWGFAYRSSNLAGYWLVGATLTLTPDDPQVVAKRMDMLLQYRSKTQPLTTSNCGSVFKNPSAGPAARWIEQAGLKGFRVGDAQVSERHANFIINTGHASARDVRELIRLVQQRVLERFKVHLEPEVKLAGEW